jgi:hypothetical protein
LLNPQVVVKNIAFGASRRCKLWLQDKMNRDDDLVAWTAAGARRLIRGLRGLRA